MNQDINFDPEFERLCDEFGLPGVRFFLQVLSTLDKTDNHWPLHDFSPRILSGCCRTKPKIILGSYALLIDMKWISVGLDDDNNQFIYARNFLKYRGNRVHENEMTKQVSCSPPFLTFKEKNKTSLRSVKKSSLRSCPDSEEDSLRSDAVPVIAEGENPEQLKKQVPEIAAKDPNPDYAPTAFEFLWDMWPKREGYTTAKKAWNKARLPKETVDKINKDLCRWRNYGGWSSYGGRYCPKLEKYIMNEGWRDDPPNPVIG